MYDWDALARVWSRKRPQQLWRRHSDCVYRELVERWIPKSIGSVLKTDAFDEAFSAGVYPALQPRARTVVAIDVSSTVLAQAQARYSGLRCVCADVRDLPLASGSIDAVVSFSTLDHFESKTDLEAGLRELARVLRPDGTLLLTLDNLACPVIALRRVLPFRLLHALGVVPYHVGWTCGPRRLEGMLEEAGLDVCRTDTIVHCPRLLAVGLAAVLDRTAGSRLHGWFLGMLRRLERLGTLPTRFLTGHFIAVLARKPRVLATDDRSCDRNDHAVRVPFVSPEFAVIDKQPAMPSVGPAFFKSRVR